MMYVVMAILPWHGNSDNSDWDDDEDEAEEEDVKDADFPGLMFPLLYRRLFDAICFYIMHFFWLTSQDPDKNKHNKTSDTIKIDHPVFLAFSKGWHAMALAGAKPAGPYIGSLLVSHEDSTKYERWELHFLKSSVI